MLGLQPTLLIYNRNIVKERILRTIIYIFGKIYDLVFSEKINRARITKYTY